MRLTVHPLRYTKPLVTYYHKLSALPGFTLLESSDSTRGRYDIVTAFPYDEFKLTRNSPDIHQGFEQFQQALPCEQSGYDFPFQGGAIGYIAYDLGTQLAGLKTTSYPHIGDVGLIDMYFYDWAIIADHRRQEVNLIAANRSPHTKAVVTDILNLWHAKTPLNQSFELLKPFTPLTSEAEYKAAFAKIHHDLMWGRAYQVNYTMPFVADFAGDPWRFYQKISEHNKTPFSAFLRREDGDIVSFSPERFLLSDNGRLLVSPIKGSAPRSTHAETDNAYKQALLSSAKNRAENTMIVDLLRNDLGKIAKPGSINVSQLCELQSFDQIHHLVSDIIAESNDHLLPLEALNACFPGGSITGAPKLEAMRIINEHEQYARGVYCGNIGYFSTHGRFDTNIAIRTILANNNKMLLHAGGGIVVDSNCDEEYQECYTKIKAITKIATIEGIR